MYQTIIMLENKGSKKDSASTNLFRDLQQGKKWAIEQLYRDTYPAILSLIKRNSGTVDDAKDLFQDCLLILIPKLREPSFTIKAAPSTYLYAIARNQWLTKLKKSSKNPVDLILDEPETGFQLKDLAGLSSKENTADSELYSLVKKALNKLRADCQKIIQMKHVHKYSHEEIMEEMEYTTSYSRLKLSKCMNQLRKLIRENPAFKIT